MRDRFTLGAEEEYQLVDADTGELHSAGSAVQAEDLTGAVHGELQEALLEIGTGVCRTAEEVGQRLRERRFQAGAAAAAQDLELLALGAHPFSGWKGHELSTKPRSLMLRSRFRHLVRLDHICGLHVHVAVPDALDRIALMNIARWYTPHLLAMSCSSPYHAGVDTGFASYRTIVWRRFPLTGPPPAFASAAEHRVFMDALLRSGLIPDERTVYWSIRPSPHYPTLEFRVCDVTPRIADAVALAALSRAIIVAAAEGVLAAPVSSLPADQEALVLAENEWLAARDGLDAVLIAPWREAGRVPIRVAINELLETTRSTIEALGDSDAIAGVEAILADGSTAGRMRTRHADSRNLRDVVAWAVAETRATTGLDRRQPDRRRHHG